MQFVLSLPRGPLNDALIDFLRSLTVRRVAPVALRFWWRAGPARPWSLLPMATPLPPQAVEDVQEIDFALNPVDQDGQPVTAFATPPAWSVDNPALLSLAPSADGLRCVGTPGGGIGTASVTVSVTKHDGSVVSDVIAVPFEHAEAASLGLSGAVVLKPAPSPAPTA